MQFIPMFPNGCGGGGDSPIAMQRPPFANPETPQLGNSGNYTETPLGYGMTPSYTVIITSS